MRGRVLVLDHRLHENEILLTVVAVKLIYRHEGFSACVMASAAAGSTP